MAEASILLNMEGVTFPNGLIGLEEYKHFNLQQSVDMIPVALMGSLEEKGLSFIVANPGNWIQNYKFEIKDEDLGIIKASSVDDLIILVIINVVSDPFTITSNMISPLVINPTSKLGIQMVLTGSPYQARQPLSLRTMSLYLKEGLLGIPEWKKFVLQIVDELLPVMLLASQDSKLVSFPIIDPSLIDPDFNPKLSDEDKTYLGINDEKELAWFVILNVQNEPFQVTANMISPIVVNPKLELARQVLLSQSGYQTAHPIKMIDPERIKSIIK